MTRKRALLKAAQHLFSTLGYEGTTFKKISAEAGVALGLLSHHYGSKEQLFLIAGLDVLDCLYASLIQECAKGGTGLERVLCYAKAFFDFSLVEENCYRLLLLSPPHWIVHPDSHPPLNKGYRRLYALLESLIEHGKKDGTINPAVPPSTVKVISCTIYGGTRMLLVTPFAPENLYDDILLMIRLSLSSSPAFPFTATEQ